MGPVRPAGRDAGARLGPERYREVRYEDLVREPERVLVELCAFVELPYDARMLRYHEQADRLVPSLSHNEHHQNLHRPPTVGLRDWRSQMSPADAAVFESLAGDLLDELGYERATSRPGARGVSARRGSVPHRHPDTPRGTRHATSASEGVGGAVRGRAGAVARRLPRRPRGAPPIRRSIMMGTAALRRRVLSRRATVGVVGQGYVGVSLACAAAEAGFSVTGVDVDERRVADLARGCSPCPAWTRPCSGPGIAAGNG